MEFSIQLKKAEREEYIEICLKIWGCVPIDVKWARNTKIYQQEQSLKSNQK